MEKDVNKTAGSAEGPNHPGNETEKSKVHIVVEVIEYMPNAVVSKTIIKKSSGNVTITSFDEDEELAEKKSVILAQKKLREKVA